MTRSSQRMFDCSEARYNIERSRRQLEDLETGMNTSGSFPSEVALPSQREPKIGLAFRGKPKEPAVYLQEVACFLKAVLNFAESWALERGCCCTEICKALPKFLGLRPKPNPHLLDANGAVDPPLFGGQRDDLNDRGDAVPEWRLPDRAQKFRPHTFGFQDGSTRLWCQVHTAQESEILKEMCRIQRQDKQEKMGDLEVTMAKVTKAEKINQGFNQTIKKGSGAGRGFGSEDASDTCSNAVDSESWATCYHGPGSFDSTEASPMNGNGEAYSFSSSISSPRQMNRQASDGSDESMGRRISFKDRAFSLIREGVQELLASPRTFGEGENLTDECNNDCEEASEDESDGAEFDLDIESPSEDKDVSDNQELLEAITQTRQLATRTGAAWHSVKVEKETTERRSSEIGAKPWSNMTQDEKASAKQAVFVSLERTAATIRELALLSSFVYPILGQAVDWTGAIAPEFVFTTPLTTVSGGAPKKSGMSGNKPNLMIGLHDPRLGFAKYAQVVLKKALTGLQHMHAQSVAHGHICPESILVAPGADGELGADPDVKLAWLPGTQRASSRGRSSTMLGFRAPEGVGLPGDMWSFACMALVWRTNFEPLPHPWHQVKGVSAKVQDEINQVIENGEMPKALEKLHEDTARAVADDHDRLMALCNPLTKSLCRNTKDRPSVASFLQSNFFQ
eukprot:CAMPEP_0178391764 /NCGR_PEP_ID=MMETSP0689_2-20121128/11332_1 /TAXON_ID=160604 /ORGANISM="Amphidinium massartii, Strain CS-259" /LENGTH=680 /DNA_ID=CAMNT_0020012319 /DNA_START=159 /DNA_END=2201 /DNA_ORIENTATION=-